MASILNVSAYKFVPLNDCEALRDRLRDQTQAAGLRGSGSATCIERGALNARLAEPQCVARLSHARSMRLAVRGLRLVNSVVGLSCSLAVSNGGAWSS